MHGNHRQRDRLPPRKGHKPKRTKEEKLSKRWRKRLKERDEREAELIRRRRALAMAGKLVLMNRGKLHSYGRLLFSSPPDSPPDDSKHPFFYEDIPFTCKDCGKQEVWTARQQKWWHEDMGGSIETTAVRCRECRAKERARKAEVNRSRIEGIERKRQLRLKRWW